MIDAPPVTLTIAGSDCSAGAGIQADLKTFQHFKLHGLTAVTCVVSETANQVRAVHRLPVAMVRDQISLLMDSFPITAVKTGMLGSAQLVRAVAEILGRQPGLVLVVDPVMVASSGAILLDKGAVAAYRERLFPLARVITPNLPEAETLLGGEKIADAAELEAAARRLARDCGAAAVLLKGGHLPGPECLDLLVDGGSVHRYTAARLALPGSHGTGCTLSAAITAALALGENLPAAVQRAKDYLGLTLRQSYQFSPRSGEMLHALNQGTRFGKNDT